MESGELKEKRKTQALEAAEACSRLLKERFGARRVILFGSLAGQGPWHGGSDIDLAVEGLEPADFFPAYSACRDLVPRGLELDLIPLEDAYPEMRARILGEVEMPDDPVLALQELIRDELTTLERVVESTEEALASFPDEPGQFELHGLAAYLHQFYTGVESIFERIAVGLGEGLPRGQYWHIDLLNQMAEEGPGGRPAVIDEPLRARLKDYLDFRHFFRHAYGYTLEWSKMRWKVENLSSTLAMLRAQLEAFFKAIQSK
ncbi:MAG: nucleotidyltransferase domain-containing protein [Chloroflexi bacterium]|nr:MAG: nucleotidyltransferase domain-containing protein [Chloroflexota bacterium]